MVTKKAVKSTEKKYVTDSNIPIKPFYQKSTKKQVKEEPGKFPFTRGIHAGMYRDRFWTMRQYAGFGDAVQSNKRYKFMLEKGQTGISMAFDLPTQIGHDPDAPQAEGEVGKVGVSGKAIDASTLIQEFLEKKGNYSIIRKIYAPIWIKGPIKHFTTENTIIVGDAAGQAKPTTAGGIFSWGIGGIMAGKTIAMALRTNDFKKLIDYEKSWRAKFGNEFEKQSLARKILSRIDNKTVNKLFDSITPEIIDDISGKDDFDFHTSSIVKLLGVKGSLNAAQLLIGGELKKLISTQG